MVHRRGSAATRSHPCSVPWQETSQCTVIGFTGALTCIRSVYCSCHLRSFHEYSPELKHRRNWLVPNFANSWLYHPALKKPGMVGQNLLVMKNSAPSRHHALDGTWRHSKKMLSRCNRSILAARHNSLKKSGKCGRYSRKKEVAKNGKTGLVYHSREIWSFQFYLQLQFLRLRELIYRFAMYHCAKSGWVVKYETRFVMSPSLTVLNLRRSSTIVSRNDWIEPQLTCVNSSAVCNTNTTTT